MAANKQSPLANRSEFLNFPVDEYVSACIISYQVASLPPSKFSKTTDPVPSVRFLLAGRVKNTEGEDVVVRKWTSWMTLSYNEKSKMAQVFKDVPNLEFLITDDEEGGALWETPFKIMLEKSKDGKYSNIIRIKVSDDKSILDICYTGKSILPDGTETFAPYRKVGAYGKLVFLEVAVNKEEDGVKFYSGEDLIENPEETDDD
jgi:hypothetical protein